MLIRIAQYRVFPHHIEPPDGAGAGGIYGLGEGEAGLGGQPGGLPGGHEAGVHVRVSHLLIAGQVVGQGSHVAGSLHVGLAAQGIDTTPLNADVAAQQLQVGDGPHVVVARGVLGDPHGVVDGGALGGADEAGELNHLFGGDAGDEGHLVRGIGGGEHLGLERLKPFHPLGDIALVVPVVSDDLLHDAVEQHHVGAGAMGQVEAGMIGHLDPFRVRYHQPCLALAHYPLDVGTDDGVGRRGIGADDEDEIRVIDARDVVGHGAAAERRLQPGDGGGVAQAGAVIHVVGGKLPAHEFLEQVVVFVGGLGRGEPSQRIAAMLCLDGTKALGHQGDRLLPTGGHQLAILADQRCGEALLALDKVKAKAPLDAEQPLVDRGVAVALHIADALPRLIHIESDAAANPAIGADGVDRGEQLGAPLGLVAGIHHGAGGADLHTGAALHAVGISHRQSRLELRPGREGTVGLSGKLQDALYCLLVARLHALATADAAVGIEHDEFAAVVHRKLLAVMGIEGALVDLVFGGIVAQGAIGIGLAAALQAAGRFGPGGGIAKALLHLGKAAAALGQMGHDGAGDLFQVGELGGVHLLEGGGLAGVEGAYRINHGAVQEVVDGQRRLAPVGDRLDGGRRPPAQIADGKQIGVTAVHGLGVDVQGIPAGEGQGQRLPFHKAQIRPLGDGGDDGIKLLDDELAGGLGAAAAGSIRFAEGHLLEPHLADAACFIGQVLHRIGQHHEAHPFVLRLVNLVRLGRHLGAGATIDEGGLGAEAHRSTGAVDGGIAATDHRNPFAGGEALLQHPILEVVHPEIAAFKSAAGVLHGHSLGGADRQTDGVVVAAQSREAELLPQALTGVDPHAALAHQCDLLIEDRLGQPVLGDAVTQPATGLGHRLEKIHGEPLIAQVVTAGEAPRAAADDGDPLALGGLFRGVIGGHPGEIQICGMALELTDGQRLIYQGAATFGLAEGRTDPADGERHGQCLLDDGGGRLVIPYGDMVQIGLDIHPGRAGSLAGGLAVGVVIREDVAERLLAVIPQGLRLGGDHHPLARAGFAGAPDADTGDLDHAEIARGLGGTVVVAAQGGDVDMVLFCYLKQGQGRINRQLSPIESESEHGVINSGQGAENAASGGASRRSDRTIAGYNPTLPKVIHNFI